MHAQRYDLTKEYLEQVKPILIELDKKCRELGMPMVTCMWTGLTADQVQISAMASANREEVTDMFVHLASIAPGSNLMGAAESVNDLNIVGAKFYTVKIEDGMQVFDAAFLE